MSPFDNKRYLLNNKETIPYCTDEIKKLYSRRKIDK